MSFKRSYISNAKINLGLTVPFRYESGYHHIVSIFAPVDLYDEMNISITGALDEASENFFSLTYENRLPAMLNFESTRLVFTSGYKNNLIYKAFEWIIGFLNEHGIALPPVECNVHVIKKIPSPAGLGGGSSNAAGIIRAVLDFAKDFTKDPAKNSAKWKNIELAMEKHSLRLGSDIPFFLHNKSALISGTGEIYQPLPGINLTGIIGIPSFGFSANQTRGLDGKKPQGCDGFSANRTRGLDGKKPQGCDGFSTRQMYQSMDKPVYHGSREELLQRLPPGNSLPTPKKALHDENSFIRNLYCVHKDYLNLYEWLCDDVSKPVDLKEENSLRNLIHKEKNESYFLNNEFIGVSQKLFPEKFKVIEKIRKDALEKISQSVRSGNLGVKLISSMSGSGAAMYAGITGKNGFTPEFQQKLDMSVASLQKEHPDVHWVKFCTIT
jgi:4-diphosphocytidyl-2C-methyl-D-erythritol kinase